MRPDKPKNTYIVIILLAIIIAVAVLLRAPTFILPHDNGDQAFYLSLAMKLDKYGLPGYTLREVDIVSRDCFLAFLTSKNQKGNLLASLSLDGVDYYDEPLYHLPPAFPYMLMFSHRVFFWGAPYTTVCRNPPDKIFFRSMEAVKSQFYCVIVPFIFSILFVLAAFWLGRIFFSNAVGLCAAALLAISPTDLLSSQKIWADDMLCFFIILSVIFYIIARGKDNLLYAAAAGVACGIATATKQSGAFLVFVIVLFHLWDKREDLFKRRFVRFIFDKHIIVFGLAAVIVALPWFYAVTRTYGTPWYQPPATVSELAKNSAWFKILHNRPWYTLLITLPYQMPLFGFAYLAVIEMIRSKTRMNRSGNIFLMLWCLVWFALIIFVLDGREERYLLPMYPAVAVLSGDYLFRKIRPLFLNRPYMAEAVVAVLIILCAVWSVPIGESHVLRNLALIRFPF